MRPADGDLRSPSASFPGGDLRSPPGSHGRDLRSPPGSFRSASTAPTRETP